MGETELDHVVPPDRVVDVDVTPIYEAVENQEAHLLVAPTCHGFDRLGLGAVGMLMDMGYELHAVLGSEDPGGVRPLCRRDADSRCLENLAAFLEGRGPLEACCLESGGDDRQDVASVAAFLARIRGGVVAVPLERLSADRAGECGHSPTPLTSSFPARMTAPRT